MAKPPIQIIAEKLAEARAMEYALQYNVLKEHIKSLSDDEFLAQMVRVDNPHIFRYLWSIGLTYRQQIITAKRWEELTK